jgi:TonB family protein
MPFTIVVAAPPASADEVAAAARALMIDRALLALWVLASVVLAWRLARGAMIVERARSAWKRGRVDGVRVRLSANVGPAVVGLRSMDVVLPEWILSLDESLRALVLRHEEEHREARDPYLLFGAALVMALMPWNVALWLQARRLRLAIEVDCDARVLRAHPSAERYGLLILTIAQRRAVAPTLFAPMLSEPTSNLERRILAMRSTRKAARLTAVGGAVVTVGVLAFASSLQSAGTSFAQPTAVSPETIPVKRARSVDANGKPIEVLKLDAVKSTAEAAGPVRGNEAPRYPVMLRRAEVEGAVMVRYSTDGAGRVDPGSIRIVSTTHELFSNAVREAAATWRATPNSTIQTPVIFSLANKSGPELADPASHPAGAMVVTATSLAGDVSAGPAQMNPEKPMFEFQIEKPATVAPGNRGPRFPDELRTAGVEGEVLAQFVVDTEGHPIVSTFKVLKSDHELFTQAVRDVLGDMLFTPAEVGGQTVKQLVQMPFAFSLSKDSRKP